MESVSLATKYRPIKFSEFFGQEQAKKQIKGFLSNGIPKSLLITGPTGTGKTTLARIIARYINKVKEVSEINDIYEINIGIDGTAEAIRDLVNQMKFLPRNQSHKKIYILDEVHRLTKTSASALLKEIEEPYSHVIFILCTNEPDNLLNTLKNRCEKIDLKAYKQNELVEMLKSICIKENINLNDDNLKTIIKFSENQPRECISSLQAINNLLLGGNKVDENIINEELKKKYSDYEILNNLLFSFYIKDLSTAFECFDQGIEDIQTLNALIAENRAILRYFSFKGKENNYINNYYLTIVKLIENNQYCQEKGIVNIAKEIHKRLYKIKFEAFTSNFNMQDAIISYLF